MVIAIERPEIEKVNLSVIPDEKSGFIIPFSTNHTPVKIFQGYDGPYSHFALRTLGELQLYYDYRFALDFKLPVGTPVLAAKSGIVLFFVNTDVEYYEGLDSKLGRLYSSNLIALMHDDETFSLYAHLRGESIKVEPKQNIRQGEIIASTGKSGWIGPEPHLHFGVYKSGYFVRELMQKIVKQTFPVRFDNYNGELFHSKL